MDDRQKPYYDPQLAAQQKALRLAAELALLIPRGTIRFGEAVIKRASDETMKRLSGTKKA